jgi:hypothetical protein
MVLLGVRGWLRLAARRSRAGVVVLALQALVVVGATGWAFVAPAVGRGGIAGALAVIAAAGLVALGTRRGGLPRLPALTCGLAVMVAAVFVVQADGTLLWSSNRMYKHELARAAAARVPAAAPLVSYALTPVVYVFETDRVIPRLENQATLAARLATVRSGCLYVLTEVRYEHALSASGRWRRLVVMPRDADDRAALYCLEPAT